MAVGIVDALEIVRVGVNDGGKPLHLHQFCAAAFAPGAHQRHVHGGQIGMAVQMAGHFPHKTRPAQGIIRTVGVDLPEWKIGFFRVPPAQPGGDVVIPQRVGSAAKDAQPALFARQIKLPVDVRPIVFSFGLLHPGPAGGQEADAAVGVVEDRRILSKSEQFSA
ncbi:hypothetical protein SDC9_181922 [bioreactor metagenome]|uniref:Uncharacterized protein n=1 Tax=bioreactor metagenome TaxID=1076179 RepID=A0A645H8L1_9ZZZZ